MEALIRIGLLKKRNNTQLGRLLEGVAVYLKEGVKPIHSGGLNISAIQRKNQLTLKEYQESLGPLC